MQNFQWETVAEACSSSWNSDVPVVVQKLNTVNLAA